MAGTTGTQWRELALDECGAVAITTSPATCKLRVRDGGKAGDRRSERNKVPGGLGRPGDGEHGNHAAGLCRIGPVMGLAGCAGCVVRSDDRTRRSSVQ